jgi:hypothetical protein
MKFPSTGHRYIYRTGLYSYRILICKKKKSIYDYTARTLEDAIILREVFLLNAG